MHSGVVNERETQEGRVFMYVLLIHFAKQKLSQHFKATIMQ